VLKLKRLQKQAKMVVDPEAQALINDLENLKMQLEEVIEEAKNISRKASKQGGEISRVVSGQLDSYLIGTLKNFCDSKYQTGSISSLLEFLEDYATYDDEEE
jgi:hypothetical protein